MIYLPRNLLYNNHNITINQFQEQNEISVFKGIEIHFNFKLYFKCISDPPVDKLASIVFCRCPSTLNCGRDTSEDICTEFNPSFHL